MSIKNKFSRTINNVSRASRDFLEVSKIKMSISSNKDKVRDLKMKMGEYIYSMYRDGNEIDSKLVGSCDEILDIEKENEILKKEILKIKNVLICHSCQGEIELNSTYCPKCGVRVSKN